MFREYRRQLTRPSLFHIKRTQLGDYTFWNYTPNNGNAPQTNKNIAHLEFQLKRKYTELLFLYDIYTQLYVGYLYYYKLFHLIKKETPLQETRIFNPDIANAQYDDIAFVIKQLNEIETDLEEVNIQLEKNRQEANLIINHLLEFDPENTNNLRLI